MCKINLRDRTLLKHLRGKILDCTSKEEKAKCGGSLEFVN
jgi:hypothetical protein